jgi:DNA-binding MarR family transcriptional regulator
MSGRTQLLEDLEVAFRENFRRLKKEFEILFGEDITPAEFFFLKHLVAKGPQMVSELSQEFFVSLSHITSVSDKLVKKNLIERKRSEMDRRVVQVDITEKGREIVEVLGVKKKEHFQRKFEHLSDEELAILLKLYKKIQ